MTKSTDIKQDDLLAETFYLTDVDALDVSQLKKAVTLANKNLIVGKLKTLDYGNGTVSIAADVPHIYSKAASKSMSTDHAVSALAELLSCLALGTVKTMNEELGKEGGNKFCLSDYLTSLVDKLLAHAEVVSKFSTVLEAQEVLGYLSDTLDELDCFDPYKPEGREDLVKYAFSRKHCEAMCYKKLASITKKMDAKALRIALLLNMKVL